uniref:Uncharacterized protein n=1 Tax=Biomphalaria glabrata TaxID=6526 RepID=A0A2C9LFX0_BIOGL
MKWKLENTLLLLTSLFIISLSAPSGSISSRDTDKISGLKYKLQRLHDLLAKLDSSDENDLKSIITQRGNKSRPVVSEDMKAEEITQAPSITSVAAPGQGHILNSKDDEDSILILSKALAKLQQPSYNNKDSTGDHLGTEYNEDNSKTDSKTDTMENFIQQALLKLSRDTSKVSKEKKTSEVATQSGKKDSLQDEALTLVEERLSKDIQLIQKLGFSIEDVIQDLSKKKEKEKELSDLETQLQELKN